MASVVPVVPQSEKTKPEVDVSQKLALTLTECAELSGLKVCFLRSAIWAGELAFVRAGERKRYLVRRDTLDRFLRSLEEKEGQ
jgi:excisionase family DNA binding protein